MYDNKATLEAVPGVAPFSSDLFYWGSSEIIGGAVLRAWGLFFNTGGYAAGTKNFPANVRAVRAF